MAVIVVVLLSVAIYRTSQVKTKADYLVAGPAIRRADKRRIAEWMQTQNTDVRATKTQEIH